MAEAADLLTGSQGAARQAPPPYEDCGGEGNAIRRGPGSTFRKDGCGDGQTLQDAHDRNDGSCSRRKRENVALQRMRTGASRFPASSPASSPSSDFAPHIKYAHGYSPSDRLIQAGRNALNTYLSAYPCFPLSHIVLSFTTLP